MILAYLERCLIVTYPCNCLVARLLQEVPSQGVLPFQLEEDGLNFSMEQGYTSPTLVLVLMKSVINAHDFE